MNVTIQYDADWGEFVVLHPDNADANYHTDDKQDAVDTAKAMFGPDVAIKHKRVSTGDLDELFI